MTRSGRIDSNTSRSYLLARLGAVRELIDAAVAGGTDPLDLGSDWQVDHADRVRAHRARPRPEDAAHDPLFLLRAECGLDAFEEDVLLIALGPSLDRSFGRALGTLRRAMAGDRPDLDLALALLTVDLPDRLARLSHFEPSAPLMRHGLLSMRPRRGNDDVLAQQMSVPARVQRRLLGVPLASEAQGTVTAPQRTLEDVSIPEDDEAQLRAILNSPPADGGFILLAGPAGSGKSVLAEGIASHLGRAFLPIDCLQVSARMPDLDATLAEILVEARSSAATVCLDDAERLLAHRLQGNPALRTTLARLVGSGEVIVLTTQNEELMDPSIHRHVLLRMGLGFPSVSQRERLWERALGSTDEALDLAFIAERYEFTGAQIEVAARVAIAAAGGVVTPAHIHDAAKAQLQHHLAQLAVRSITHLTLDDVILPADLKRTLYSVVAAVRNRRRIFEDWGFGERLTTGKGLALLFRGESGTGKTLSAEILASHLAMPIYRVAIPRIVSKYIGETEQNLEKAFREAQVAGAILLFDEADAIFTKRVEVSSATDRYSNMEVNLLLQELERFEGVVILTTNLDAAIDDAFDRRLNYKLDFPFPTQEHRREIWRKLLPPSAPVVLAEVELEYLAERFELSGGSIKNVVLRAAYGAAEADTDIGIDLLEGAAIQEYRELGKLIAAG